MTIHGDDQMKKILDYVKGNMFRAHRGAMNWHNDIVIVFGNDGYDDDPSVRQEVADVESWVSANDDVERLGFAHDGYSWVLVVRSADANASIVLNRLLWASWQASNARESGERDEMAESAMTNPERDWSLSGVQAYESMVTIVRELVENVIDDPAIANLGNEILEAYDKRYEPGDDDDQDESE